MAHIRNRFWGSGENGQDRGNCHVSQGFYNNMISPHAPNKQHSLHNHAITEQEAYS